MQNLTRKTCLKTASLLTIALLTNTSFADEEASSNSNLNDFTYPNHTCKSKPVKPNKPRKLSSDNNVERYNLEISKYNINVVAYNKEIIVYKACINQYIKNGNNDIKIIRQRLNNALKEARSKKL
jgi:hypothetical protein